jgi:putative FmdB family regulatory protein
MPLYTYKCDVCGHEFDEIMKMDDRDVAPPCKLCKKESHRKIAVPFSHTTKVMAGKDTIHTPKEIDQVVGRDAEKKWTAYDERWRGKYEARQKKRWGGQEPQAVNIPKNPDGTYTPVAHLGDKKQRGLRGEFSTALKEHRAEREKKGIPQFDAPGAITTD